MLYCDGKPLCSPYIIRNIGVNADTANIHHISGERGAFYSLRVSKRLKNECICVKSWL